MENIWIIDAHSHVLNSEYHGIVLLGETFAFASKSPPPALVYSKLERRYLLPLRKVLVLSAWSPQAFLQITPLHWVLSQAVSPLHPLPKIDGRGSEIFLRAKDLLVVIELGAVSGFAPLCAPLSFPWKCHSLMGFVLAIPFLRLPSVLCFQCLPGLGSSPHVGL